MMRRSRHDAGVTIVEAAFVLPLLFTFVFGLIDLGMWTFNSNQATNAARDGARVGILSYEDADDHAAIVAAVQAHLPEGTLDASDVTITCLRPDGSALSCSSAEQGDEIRVEVEWSWDLVTPVSAILGITEGAAKGSATMAIVGLPVAGNSAPDEVYEEDTGEPPPPDDGAEEPATEPPPACEVIGVPAVTPRPVETHGNQLKEDLVVKFTTNESAACLDLRVELVGSKHSPQTVTLSFDCACGEGPEHTWIYRGSDNIWQKNNDGIVRILDGTEPATRAFPVS